MECSVCLATALLLFAPSAEAYLTATSGVELLPRVDTFVVGDGHTISDASGLNLPYETDWPIGLLTYGALGMSDFEITLPACESPRFLCEVFEVELSGESGVVLRLEALDPELALVPNIGHPVMLGTFKATGPIVPRGGLVEDVLGSPFQILDPQGRPITPITWAIIPEPGSALLLIAGLAGLLGLRRQGLAH